MKLWARLIVPVMVLGLVGIADAKGAGKHHGGMLRGKVVSVATDGSSVVIQSGKKTGGAQVTVQTTTSTTVTIDGVAAKVTDLQQGEKVSISPKTGAAITIKATTKKHHKKA